MDDSGTVNGRAIDVAVLLEGRETAALNLVRDTGA